ncbi:hypothetical protein [Streptomyces sp. NPDC059783]|uniref:hypothetical protein n=1 Tax=Streptomyces sp. NPDC059783 TaxID=3346944 RepID=UPI00365CA0AE
MPVREHQGRHYAIQFGYSLHDDAWHVELSEAGPAPAEWAGNPAAVSHLPGAAFLIAVIPDEDPELEPTVHLYGDNERAVPYEIMRWFMEHVTEEVERCRAAFEQGGPEAVT